MRILIACEYSGVEREAFRALGHDTISCDLLPADDDSPNHYQGDVRDLMGEHWDMVIAHPPCTFLSLSGVRWLYMDQRGPDGQKLRNLPRWADMIDGAGFFRLMFDFDTPRLCVENPRQHGHAIAAHGMGKCTQEVQPWQFGHPESKATDYWLRGLPPLVATDDVSAVMATLPKSQTSRIHYASPGKDRWKLRSTSFAGIAQAMADQWAGPADDRKEHATN